MKKWIVMLAALVMFCLAGCGEKPMTAVYFHKDDNSWYFADLDTDTIFSGTIPDKLTDDEFSKMKNHAGYTYIILSEVEDFEEIRDWASFHHEKLNGKGYPFGKTAAELNEPERIMACIDIYQALTEDRPYKKGLSHEKTCEMLDDMAQKGFVDSDISKKIRECFGGI